MTSSLFPSFIAKLTSRGLVRVKGPDSLNFLQGLVTNDVHKICGPSNPSTQATAFLNGRGRVLFGVLLHRQNDNDYLIDIEKSKIPALTKHLRMYKLRAKVDVEEDDLSVWSFFGRSPSCDGVGFDDPRLPALGTRAIAEKSTILGQADEEESAYTRLRILNGVPDGSDFEGTPLPLDLALHMLNGVSFSKGCYLGQELTARSHFTGVLRKRITPIILSPEPVNSTEEAMDAISTAQECKLPDGAELFVEGRTKPAGQISSSIDNLGLAVLRLSDVFGEGRLKLSDGRTVYAWKPEWWSIGEVSGA